MTDRDVGSRAHKPSFGALVCVAFVLALLAASSAAGASNQSGKLLFKSNRSGTPELYTVNRDGSDITRVTFNDIDERAPRWSPDATKIVFSAFVNGNSDIYTIHADGSGLDRLTSDPANDLDPVWTADGRNIIYDRGLFSCPCSLRAVKADGTNDHALTVGPGNSYTPDVSPDGTTLAFANDRAGTFAIYTSPVTGGTTRRMTDGSSGGDFQPRWSPSGHDVLFLRDVGAGDNNIWLVTSSGRNLRQLTNTPSRIEFGGTWSPDGRQIVFFADSHLYSIGTDGSGETELLPGPQAPFTETFDRDGIMDTSLFHTINDPGGSVVAAGGRLVAAVLHDADPSTQPFDQIDEHIGTQCTLNGDFDVQVDYALLTWPPHGGFFAMLNGIFADGAIARVSTAFDAPYDESYNGWSSGPPFLFDQANTSDRAGQMRLARRAGVLYEYARNGPAAPWTLIHTGGPATGNTVASVGLWAPENTWAHVDGSVAYDNLFFRSGVFTCPTWWADTGPDWQPAGEDGQGEDGQ